MKNYQPVPYEDEECKAFVQYLELLQAQGKVIKFTHTANETYTNSWKQKNRNKAMGVRSGIPDYIIIVRVPSTLHPYRVVFVEMKRRKHSATSKEQKEWLSALSECLGCHASICKGFDKAKEFIDNIIKG